MASTAVGGFTGRSWRRIVVMLGAVIALGTAGAYGWSQAAAQPQQPEDVVLFCVNIYTGGVRHIQQPSHCPEGWVLEVDNDGTQGPPGPAGPAGPVGPPGQQGPPGGGVEKFQVVIEVVEIEANEPLTRINVDCPDGEFATGGGFSDLSKDLLIHTSTVLRSSENDPTSWAVDVSNPTADAVNLEVRAICTST